MSTPLQAVPEHPKADRFRPGTWRVAMPLRAAVVALALGTSTAWAQTIDIDGSVTDGGSPVVAPASPWVANGDLIIGDGASGSIDMSDGAQINTHGFQTHIGSGSDNDGRLTVRACS